MGSAWTVTAVVRINMELAWKWVGFIMLCESKIQRIEESLQSMLVFT